ncbi:MAG: CCA tRNA nucleotidyltransferase, partial [Leptospiraceae bacterium]|nr:CCA tRNA nucleotidyltransferase [Leptospiraceae bacterium]
RDNQFGNPKEDAARRDFTINAIYFDPRNECIIDYVDGVTDIEQKRITAIGDPDISFREDPVRMLRAAKFAALLDFQLHKSTLKAIRQHRGEMSKASSARLIEEYYKIFRTGQSLKVMKVFHETGLFRELFSEACQASDLARHKEFEQSSIGKRFVIADQMLEERETLTTVVYLALILADLVKGVTASEAHNFKGNIQEYVRTKLLPACQRMNIAARDRERLIQIFMAQGRFAEQSRRSKTRPAVFRKKVFFYESFMFYKINALAIGDNDAIQNAMFWEVGLRMSPPDPSRVVTTFFPKKRKRQNDG